MDQDPEYEKPDYDGDPDESSWCLQVSFEIKLFIQFIVSLKHILTFFSFFCISFSYLDLLVFTGEF